MMARSFSKRLSYNSKGNEATLTIEHRPTDMASPQGFREEEAVKIKRGDIVFREGEASTFVYYILSGRFSIFHKKQHVGFITPADIFMGEMSFLLDNRRSATVRAEEDGKLIRIPKKSFIKVIKSYPHYGIFLSRLLARKLARTNDTTARYMSGQEE
jgi:CRP-like cAMP-binding protein